MLYKASAQSNKGRILANYIPCLLFFIEIFIYLIYSLYNRCNNMPKKIIDEFSNLPQKYRWRKRHPEKWKVNNDKADKKWRESDKGRLSKKKTALKIHRKLRLKVITLLGGKCSNPFNIDHSSFEK